MYSAYAYDNVSDSPLNANVAAQTLFVYGGNGDDHVEAITSAFASIGTGAGNDYISTVGSFGSVSINGGAGADIMIGGSEYDTYMVDDVGDQVIDLGGNFGSHDSVSTTLLTYTLGANIEDLDLLVGDASGYGNELDNNLTGSDGNNILNGFAGYNVLEGRGGNDRFLVTSDQSRNAIFGGTGDDTLVYKQGLGGGELPWAIDHGQSAIFDGEDGTDNAALDFSLAQRVTATVDGDKVVYDILGADGYHSTVSLTSVERVNIIGSAAADTFYGTSGNDWSTPAPVPTRSMARLATTAMSLTMPATASSMKQQAAARIRSGPRSASISMTTPTSKTSGCPALPSTASATALPT